MLGRYLKNNNSLQKVSVSGNAVNITNHAAIITANDEVYFIENMNKWDEDWLNRKINVIGEVEKVKSYKVRSIKSALVKLMNK